MTDINNNPSEDQGGHNLKAWLQSVTDPNKDPWSSEEWKGLAVLDGEEEVEEDKPIDPTLDRELEKGCCVVVGGTDSQGRPEGNVSVTWSNGDSFKGQYVGGQREGWGIVSSPDNEILALTGVWTHDRLEGKGRLVSTKYFLSIIFKINNNNLIVPRKRDFYNKLLVGTVL